MVDDKQAEGTPTPEGPQTSHQQQEKRSVPASVDQQPTSLEHAFAQNIQQQSTPDSKVDRTELVSRARTFLSSPQIQHQEIGAKRQFLKDKGLTEAEIDGLLRELPPQVPRMPPRTYPQFPPSNLPSLLLGSMRLLSWIAGGVLVLGLIYHRYLLPLITRSQLARRSLRSHHLGLFRKLSAQLSILKESQAESFAVLPRPEPYREPLKFATCCSLDDIVRTEALPDNIPPVTLLRCSIEDFGKMKQGECPTTEELFQMMQGKFAWLATPEGAGVVTLLWNTLTTSPLFQSSSHSNQSGTPPYPQPVRWSYSAPPPSPPSPILTSLSLLSEAMPRPARSKIKQGVVQHTLQALSDFTGYISTQVYLPYRPPGMSLLSPTEEEVRREIRALKGLVLNRRTFMPTIPKASTTS